MVKKGLKIITFVLVGVVFVHLAVLGTILSVFLVSGYATHNNGGVGLQIPNKAHSYHSLMVNPETKEVSSEFISMTGYLDRDEFISTHDSDGNYHLISNVEMEEYQCFGNCACKNNDRRSSITLSRGIFYLVAAASSVVAMERAKEYFTEQCYEEMNEECTQQAIQAEVDSCSDVNFVLVNEQEGEKEKVVEETKKDDGDEKDYHWTCHGECLFNEIVYNVLIRWFDMYEWDQKDAKAKNRYKFLDKQREECENLKVSKELTIRAKSLSIAVKLARERFMEETLRPFCLTSKEWPDYVPHTETDIYETYILPLLTPDEAYDLENNFCVADQTLFDSQRLKCRRIK